MKIPYPADYVSNQQGVTAITKTPLMPGDTVVGYSLGSMVISTYLANNTPPPGVNFILLGNTSSFNGLFAAIGLLPLLGRAPRRTAHDRCGAASPPGSSSATSWTFSRAVRVGTRLKNWKTKPTVVRRFGVSSSAGRPLSSDPATRSCCGGRRLDTADEVQERRLARAGRSQQDNERPAWIARLTSRRAWTAASPSPYRFDTSSRRTTPRARRSSRLPLSSAGPRRIS